MKKFIALKVTHKSKKKGYKMDEVFEHYAGFIPYEKDMDVKQVMELFGYKDSENLKTIYESDDVVIKEYKTDTGLHNEIRIYTTQFVHRDYITYDDFNCVDLEIK